jgi:hypothetical protein
MSEIVNEGKSVMFVDKKVCLICTHLVGAELGKKTKSCTAKKGNTKCPAQYYTIEIGFDVNQILSDFYNALAVGDVAQMMKILAEAQTNPKVEATIVQDLKDRLFEPTSPSEAAVEALVVDSSAEEDEDEDEDVD